MRSEKKKSRKSLFIIVFVILCLLLLWINYVSIKGEKEDRFRTRIMLNINDTIVKHQKKYNEYPQNLLAMDLQPRVLIEEYIQSGVYSYSRDPAGKEWYKLICRFSGSMKIGEGKHDVSWSGLQVSNSREQLDIMPGAHSQADKNGFYPVDLH